MRFREDKPEDLDRARAAVAAWREKYPKGTEEELIVMLGPEFHSDYGPVLRGALFAVDRDRANEGEVHEHWISSGPRRPPPERSR